MQIWDRRNDRPVLMTNGSSATITTVASTPAFPTRSRSVPGAPSEVGGARQPGRALPAPGALLEGGDAHEQDEQEDPEEDQLDRRAGW